MKVKAVIKNYSEKHEFLCSALKLDWVLIPPGAKINFQILLIFKNCNEILILNKEMKIKMKIIKN